jgi:hypothetical protein
METQTPGREMALLSYESLAEQLRGVLIRVAVVQTDEGFRIEASGFDWKARLDSAQATLAIVALTAVRTVYESIVRDLFFFYATGAVLRGGTQ